MLIGPLPISSGHSDELSKVGLLKLRWRAQSQTDWMMVEEERNRGPAFRSALVETPQALNPARRGADEWFPESAVSVLNSKRTAAKEILSPNFQRKSRNLPYSHLSLLIPTDLLHNRCEVIVSNGNSHGNRRYTTSFSRLGQSCAQGPSDLRRSSVSSWLPHPGQHNLQSLLPSICQISGAISSEDHRPLCRVSCLAGRHPH